MQRMRPWIPVVVIIVSLLILVALLVPPILQKQNVRESTLRQKLSGMVGSSPDLTAKELEKPWYPSGQVASGTGGGGSGSSGGSGSTVGNSCIMQIAYGITDVTYTSICNTYVAGVCVDKTVTCSLIAHNVDDDTPGIFEIGFDLLLMPEKETVQSAVVQAYISANDEYHFEKVFSLTSEEVDGVANHDYSCQYTSVTIPEKTVSC